MSTFTGSNGSAMAPDGTSSVYSWNPFASQSLSNASSNLVVRIDYSMAYDSVNGGGASVDPPSFGATYMTFDTSGTGWVQYKMTPAQISGKNLNTLLCGINCYGGASYDPFSDSWTYYPATINTSSVVATVNFLVTDHVAPTGTGKIIFAANKYLNPGVAPATATPSQFDLDGTLGYKFYISG